MSMQQEHSIHAQDRTLPKLIWPVEVLHQTLMECLDAAFKELRSGPTFDSDRREFRCCVGTKTTVRQSPLLGLGGQERKVGGLYRFVERYVRAEAPDASDLGERCGFERYQDFVLYTGGKWLEGKKLPIMVLEAESNSAELLAEIAGLMVVRCPVKYLFISEAPQLFERLTSYCADPNNGVTDWAGTTYFVVEIPNEPRLPSSWKTYRADLGRDREKISFRHYSQEPIC